MQTIPANYRHRFNPQYPFILALLLLLLIPANLWAIGHPYVVKDINANGDALRPGYDTFPVLGNTIIFAADDGINGREIWKSDGTDAGTVLVKDIYPGATGSDPQYLTAVNGKVVFVATDPVSGTGLWVTDGTASGTQMLMSGSLTGNNPFHAFAVVGDTFYIFKDTKLIKTDGTPAGTIPVTDFTPDSYDSIYSMKAVDGKLYVTTSLSATSYTYSLWIYDPAAGITTRLTSPSTNSFYFLESCGGKAFFKSNGLWVSDGTVSGTRQVKDLNIYFGRGRSGTACLGTTLYFGATDSANGTELWQSDGTDSGTVQALNVSSGAASSFPFALVPFNGKLLFQTEGAPSAQSNLWLTDGTDIGTALIKNITSDYNIIYPRPYDLVSDAVEVLKTGNRVFFNSISPRDYDLWVTDGTTDGTFALSHQKQMKTVPAAGFTVMGNTLFYSDFILNKDADIWVDNTTYRKLMAVSLTPAPYSRIISPESQTYSANQSIVVTGKASSDTGSPVALVEISTDNGLTWAPVNGTASWNYTWQNTTEGDHYLLVRATDMKGVVETPGPAVQVVIDRTPPAGTVVINNNDAQTNVVNVTLTVSVDETIAGRSCQSLPLCGIVLVEYSNDGVLWTSTYGGGDLAQVTKPWTLLRGDGMKTVYLRLTDRARNTFIISDTIELINSGEKLPSSTITSPSNNFITTANRITVTGTASANASSIMVSCDGFKTGKLAYGTNWSVDIDLPVTKTYTIQSKAYASGTIEVPSTGITVTVKRADASLALWYGVWTLDATDGICSAIYPSICGSLEMSLDGFTWQPATIHPGTGGPLWLRDSTGNLLPVVYGSIINAISGPVNILSSPYAYYSFVQHAYSVALSGDLIKLKSTVTENLTLSRSTNVTIRGGYDSSFNTVTGTTPITGNLTVQAGSNVIENINLMGNLSIEGGVLTASGISLL